MSRKTISRRWQKIIDAIPKNTDERAEKVRELVLTVSRHLISGSQPQRRVFLGKTSGFSSKEERRTNQRMLKAYLKGSVLFRDGFKDKKNKDGDVVARVPNFRVVKSINYFAA